MDAVAQLLITSLAWTWLLGKNQAVMGRDLHTFLEVKEPYTDWFKRMTEYGFVAGQDFDQKNLIGQDKLGRRRETINHIVSLDMAKEISMIQRTGKKGGGGLRTEK